MNIRVNPKADPADRVRVNSGVPGPAEGSARGSGRLSVARWRRWVLAVLIVIAVAVLYDAAVLASTSAKVLDHGRLFDWWRGPVSRSKIWIGQVPADVYATSRSRSQLVFVHGVNETGKDSPVLRPVAEAFAGSGFRVVVPDFERLKRQNVTPADIEDVSLVVRSLHGPCGIVCASYGCGPALIAASSPDIRDHIRFVVTFGSYFDLENTLRYIITGPPSDLAYSKWIYLAGNVDGVASPQDRQQLLAIADERRARPRQQWTLDGAGMSADARALLALFESETESDFDVRLEESPLLRERLERLSPSHYISGLRARLIIVHLDSDPSIPSSESLRMAEAAAANGIPYSLTVLNMYGHTQPAWPPLRPHSLFAFYMPQSWKFIRALNEVLSFA